MAVERTYKYKFDRKYWGFNPDRFSGPTTNILDTVVKPKSEKEN